MPQVNAGTADLRTLVAGKVAEFRAHQRARRERTDRWARLAAIRELARELHADLVLTLQTTGDLPTVEWAEDHVARVVARFDALEGA